MIRTNIFHIFFMEIKKIYSCLNLENLKVLTLCLLSSADYLCKQFGPRSGPTNVGPDLDPNCLTH